jgi:hypothetical protein
MAVYYHDFDCPQRGDKLTPEFDAYIQRALWDIFAPLLRTQASFTLFGNRLGNHFGLKLATKAAMQIT